MSVIAISEPQTGYLGAETPDAELVRAAAVSVDHVSKSYPIAFRRVRQLLQGKCLHPIEALRDVTFDIREGEIFGVIGPNGAGKTTITKIIGTLIQPSSGKVVVNGYDSAFEDNEVRNSVGLAAAEERSFYWRLTVRQNLMFFARLYGLSDKIARRRIDHLVALLELGEYLNRRFGELSTGNKQRMGLARALINNPPVLLLDEPTRSLDPMAAASLRAAIRSLSRQDPPVSILLTSHNLLEVEELCARVAIFSRGEIRGLGTPKDLRALDTRTERLHLTVRGMLRERAIEMLSPIVQDFNVVQGGPEIVITFTHEEMDEKLDAIVRILHEDGASLLAVESERTTLLNVLESYERERAKQDWGESRC